MSLIKLADLGVGAISDPTAELVDLPCCFLRVRFAFLGHLLNLSLSTLGVAFEF